MKISNEAKIGVFIVIVLVSLAAITWKTVGYEFIPNGYKLVVTFKNIDGVELNAPVTLNGMEVGRVDAIRIRYGDATRVELTLWMKTEAKLHQGARAYVKNMGFLGEKYVALSTGEDGRPFLEPGMTIEGEEPVDFQDILSKGEVIAGNIEKITANVEERLRVNSQAIDSILADTRISMANVASISSNVKERLDANKQTIDETVKNLNLTSKNLEEMSYDLKENPWKLMYKPRTKDVR